ncbi:MAG: sugar transporter ATPase [Paenibacillaceae bacterium]|nr:sugar transporter ATPase [Paenibacillaceae bacterium]
MGNQLTYNHADSEEVCKPQHDSAPVIRKGFFYRIKKDMILYLMLLVPTAYILVFKYGSMYGVAIAFQDYNIFQGITKSPWNNFATFIQIFKMNDFYLAVRNTLLLNFLELVVSFPAPVILAIMLNELQSVRFKKLSQTLLYLPHFLSWVIIGGIATQLFASKGMINHVIEALGGSAVPFLSDKWHWLAVYTVIGVWQSMGWGTILYLAAITSIDRELYEAVDVDGAGRLRKIWHVTLPGMKPTIFVLLILQLGKIMAISFDRPYILGNSLVMDFSDVISTYVYRIGIASGNFSVGAAVGLFQSVVCLIFVLGANFLTKKFGEQGIW